MTATRSKMTNNALPQHDSFEYVKPAAGYFGDLDLEGGSFVVNGWMRAPSPIELNRFALYLNQTLIGQSSPRPAPETDEAAQRAGHKLFNFQPVKTIEVPQFSRIDVVGYAGDEPRRRLTTLYRGDLDTQVPTPPEHLMYRVTANKNGRIVKEAGVRCMSNFLDALRQHRELSTVRRLLDWGCGCGRVTVHLLDFLARYQGLEIHGCDIDGEAIAWCNEHVRPGHFRHVDPYPPLPWSDNSFDVVVSCSVFTHLSEELQELWLLEIRRILAPRGLFLASINSHFVGEAPATGISDETLDTMLDGIAPPGYYRGTVQSEGYTNERWSNVFDVLAFIEYGIEGAQDLLVMRKP